MKKERIKIKNIPAIVWGKSSDAIYLYVHGQGGRKEEAELFAGIAEEKGWQVISIDLPGHGEREEEMDHFDLWHVTPELTGVMQYIRERWKKVSLFANSIGAWYSMLSYQDEAFTQCLFLSPVLDMYRLISNMIQWAGTTEECLKEKGVIPTDFGQTLYWDYYQYAKKNAITEWKHPTSILYGTKDHLIEYEVVKDFSKRFHCELSVMEGGEHWFHTKEQLAVMEKWARKAIIKN